MHPFEAIGYSVVLFAPAFLWAMPVSSLALYIMTVSACATLDHSGVTLTVPGLYHTAGKRGRKLVCCGSLTHFSLHNFKNIEDGFTEPCERLRAPANIITSAFRSFLRDVYARGRNVARLVSNPLNSSRWDHTFSVLARGLRHGCIVSYADERKP